MTWLCRWLDFDRQPLWFRTTAPLILIVVCAVAVVGIKAIL